MIKELHSITFITGNLNKLHEVKDIFGNNTKYILKSKHLDLPELQGEPEEICRQKAKYAAKQVDGPVLIEDTSLCFTALNNLPGPYIKWFYDKIGNQGLYNLLFAYPDKSAKAVCIFALCWDQDSEPILFHGECTGVIVQPVISNKKTFGWDPIFKPDKYEQTFAEMDSEIKNKISHRLSAIKKLVLYLSTSSPTLL